ncbi:MAG: ABC transporter ATP-binding protein [Candidatus Caldarchaeum sp.]|nr:ABC transporter ATP-binding protein [Candidatus Caldarchaeum sp.]
MNTSENIVELDDVRVYFPVRRFLSVAGYVRAVDGVSVVINRGETLALVGESGSGKTTLGKSTIGLVKPTSGKVLFDGVNIAELDEKQLKKLRRKAGVIFQDPYSSINPGFTVYRAVEEPLVINRIGDSKERRERVLRALSDVKLNPPEFFASKYPHMLSGGQRQRVAIARAIISNPEFIVADEPVTMLDASIRVEILLLLREIQQKHGLTILYITHDMATAKYFSDRLAVMYAGNIVEVGPTKLVLKDPKHPYTQALIEAVPEPDPRNRLGLRKVVPGEPPNPANPPSGCKFHPRCPQFIKGKCDLQQPTSLKLADGREVSCFLYDRGP